MTDCQGTYLPEMEAEDSEDGIRVLRCSGCSDRLVIIGYRGYDVKGAANAQDAARDAMRQRMEERVARAG